MNWIGFARLIRSIYGGGVLDIDWIQRQGLLAVKIGQVHALRIDFLPRETCEELSKLYRRTVTLPPADFRALLAAKAPSGFSGRFSAIDDRPLAAASIGQIHRATLTDGRRVVIKAVKADFKSSFARDVRSVERLFRLIILFYPALARVANPLGILEDIRRYTLSELDLTNEARGQRVLKDVHARFAARFDLSKLAFAAIHEDLSNEDVLVSDFIDGLTFDELLERGELSYPELLDLFLIHGMYMFVAGTFHGDIHPGNVVRSGGKLYFVDTGSLGQVTPKLRDGLLDFFEALSADAYDACAAALNGMSEVALEGTEYARFRERFLALYADFTGRTVSEVSLTRKMMETIKLGVRSGMRFEQGMFPIIRSLMYLDGMVLRCNPRALLIRDMRPFIAGFRNAGK